MEGSLTVGELVAFNMLASWVSQPVLRLAQVWQDFHQTRISIERLGDILNTAPEPSHQPGRSALPALRGAIRFDHGAFRCRAGGPTVLPDLSFEVGAGQVAGVVGPSESGKSTVAKLQDDRCPATRSNETWAMDFVHDRLATGRKIWVLTIVETFSPFSPAVDPRFSYRGEDVVLTLERVCRSMGYPQSIPVDQGLEFVSRDLDLWAYQKGVVLDFSRPGKPTDNGFIESFNGKFRAECLNTHWSMSLDDARAKMEPWRRDYNEVRPHSVIGNKPPITLMNGSPAYPPG